MQYNVRTPDDYLRVLEDDWRRTTLMALRDLIIRDGPDLRDSIKYRMLTFEDDRGPVFALNAQKSYVSLYVGDADKVDSVANWSSALSTARDGFDSGSRW
jgi:hypothetical protein